jgi:carbamoyl-phosphate synthase large subunit
MTPPRPKIKKILLLGSGAIRIGQAGEFDYSGSQAIKALKEDGIQTILINPNIATIQTSEHLADKVYFLPLTAHFVEAVIKKEKPDGILLGFGGQTALNVGLELHDKGILKKHHVKILGTPIQAIKDTEDRDLFVKRLTALHLKTPRSTAVTTIHDALTAADHIGYPVMCRIAYALGGLGSGVAYTKTQLQDLATKAFAYTTQLLIEEYLDGWKELEYEVVRDHYNNCIVVCSMENLDPMGIHTGESIVVAPVQTLTATENFTLRSIAIKVIRSLGIIGECNIQFALDPKSDDYRIIEVNARLSRSSALASKATGYPLAFTAAKLALDHSLTDITNKITGTTQTCFEPALDYIVVKYPRWDLQKFHHVTPTIGSEMKSVGEVMAIGRSFEEALQKAIRMLDVGPTGLTSNTPTFDNLDTALKQPTDKRAFAIAQAFHHGYTLDQIHTLTKVDPWFLAKIHNIVTLHQHLEHQTIKTITPTLLRTAKQHGFADTQLADLLHTDEHTIRRLRTRHHITPVVKQIDTLAAEYPAQTNYVYLTYHGTTDDLPFTTHNQVIVLGGGAYRIGSSVEFDWCAVNTITTLQTLGYHTIMINCNPETVSTDFDTCDKLYFEELTTERILDIYDKEHPRGIIISMGGQIPNNLALPLAEAGVKILGTSPTDIDRAEDRHKFSALLDTLDIDQPAWKELTNLQAAEDFAANVGYPVLIRPSYVLSGAAMSIALSPVELRTYLKKASAISTKYPVVISKFITDAKEIEIDAVANHGTLFCYAITEHIENAGVHSGDATMVLPPQRTYLETMRRIKTIARQIAACLHITGPFNIQFIAKDNDVKVIECNLRASRSFPFVSKVLKLNFIDYATRIIMNKPVTPPDQSAFDLDYVGVKASQFSFTRLKGSDPVLGVEMASTGEVACLGDDFNEAFIKSLLSVGFRLPKKTILLSTGPISSKADLLESIKILHRLGYQFYATEGTSAFMNDHGIPVERLHWPLDNTEPNTLTYLANHAIDLVINIPKNIEREELDNDYLIRRKAVDFDIPLITNAQLAKRFVEALAKTTPESLRIKSWDEYTN